MFSQTSEYALRAVACLARRPGEPMTTRQIAILARIPADYLAKILQALARAGIVTGQRGVRGGFVLARRPEDLTLLDVVHVADGSRRITTCPLGLPEHGGGLCPLHRRLDDAAALAEQALSGVTIAGVLAEPLCSTASTDNPACAGEAAGPCGPDRGAVPHPQVVADRGAGTPRPSPFCDLKHAPPGAPGEAKVAARSA
jgi:Rrf2 family protein